MKKDGSGMAIASTVLGIASCLPPIMIIAMLPFLTNLIAIFGLTNISRVRWIIFLCPILGVTAILLGIIAIFRPMTDRWGLRRRFAIAGIVTGLVGILLFIAYTWPHPDKPREKAQRIYCASNLKQIGLALRMYASDNSGWFPEPDGVGGLEMLRREGYLENPKTYICISTDHPVVTDGQPMTEATVSYVYFGGGLTEADSGNLPVVFDKPGNHRKYINVLFIDGRVSGFTLPEIHTCEEISRFLIHSKKISVADGERLIGKACNYDVRLSRVLSRGPP